MMQREKLQMYALWFLTVVSTLLAVSESWVAVMLMFCSWLCLDKACSLMKSVKMGS